MNTTDRPYSLTERVLNAFVFLNRGLGDHAPNRAWLLGPLMKLVTHRLHCMRNRLLSLIAAFEAGTLGKPRKPRAGAAAGAAGAAAAGGAEGAAAGAETAKPKRERKPGVMERTLAPMLLAYGLPMPRLPNKTGWLMQLAPAMATRMGRSWLELLLAEPRMAELIALAPERAGRTLRPLCRALDVPVPDALRLPERTRKRRSRANPNPCGKRRSRSGAMPGSALYGKPLRDWPSYLRPLPRSITLPKLEDEFPGLKRKRRPEPGG